MTQVNGGGRASDAPREHGINLMGLVALVISSSIGSGVFALSTDISKAASPGGALVAWAIAGAGFMALASAFGRLSLDRPDLHGLAAYAREGFGPFIGFISGWGYWLSIWMGIVAFGVMFATTLGYFVPALSHGLTVWSIVVISLLDWALVGLVNRGVEQASIVNAVVMVCKLVPIFAFIVLMAAVFDPATFTADFWGTLAGNLAAGGAGGAGASVGGQIVSCLMVMMWVFVGMEGACVLGHRARRAADVSRATVLGSLALVVVYVAASVLPYGYLPREELMAVPAPSMPYLFARVAGPWGGAFVSAGLIVSIFGASLSYTMLASETMCEMAQMKLLPRLFSQVNAHGAPTAALIATGAMVQALTVVMLFSQAAYQFAYSLCTASIVISWSLAAAFQAGEARRLRGAGWARRALVAGFAAAFLAVSVVIAGAQLLLLCCIAYVPGIVFYVMARRQHGEARVMTRREMLIALAIALAATAAIIGLATQVITI